MTEKQRAVLPVYLALVLDVVLLTSLFWQWFFNQFWLYDSQNRNLNPKHYEAEVLTTEEFSRLSDPEVATITLDDGNRQFTQVPADDWEKAGIPKFKSVYDGRYFVRVTTKGTAHTLWDWYPTFVSAVCFNLMILTALLVYLHNLSRRSSAAQPGPAADTTGE